MNAALPALPRHARVCAAALCLSLCGSIPASADQILQIYGDTLTTVKYTSATVGQNLRPRFDQRGVGIDGSLRVGGGYAWALNGNPFESGGGSRRLGDLDLPTGTYTPTEIDIALPAPGIAKVVIGRAQNHRQEVSAAHHDSAGYQGYNWSQLAQPEIVFIDNDTNPATRQAADLIYLVYRADAQIEFKRTAADVDSFQARNGAAGVIIYSSGSPETYAWYDQRGNKTTFFGGNTGGNHANYQFWKVEDPAGNVAYVGHATTASTADDSYTNKRVLTMYDGAARRYCFTYNGSSLLTQVLVETDAGGGWGDCGTETMVAKVEYAYYVNADAHGSDGDLKLVTITMPMSDSGVNGISRQYYRYYDDTWADSASRRGVPHLIKMVVDYEGTRKYDWDADSALEYGGPDPEFLSASDADLKPYCAAFLEYVSSSDFRVKSALFNGECGCGGISANNGTYTFTYGAAGSYSTYIGNTTYESSGSPALALWALRTVVTRPDAIYATDYFDETGQPLSSVVTDGDPAVSYTDMWATEVIRNEFGQVIEVRSPATNDNSYTHSTGAFSAKSGDGLITLYQRISGSSDTDGFVSFTMHKKGTGGTEYYDAKTEYATRTLALAANVTRPLVSAHRSYHVVNVGSASKDTAANYRETTYTNTFWSGTSSSVEYVALKQVQTTFPAVTTANNGSDSPLSSSVYLRKDATAAFTQSTGGRVDSLQYTNGQLTKRIEDADTDDVITYPDNEHPNDNFGIPETLDGVHRITEHTYDAQGRPDTTTPPHWQGASGSPVQKSYYSRLGDQRMVTISFPRQTAAGGGTRFGPASYAASNHAGKPEVSGVIAITSSGLTDSLTLYIDESDADAITAVERGTLARLSTTVYNKPGTRVEQTRAYYDIPGSGAGADGTNYDATLYAYDNNGRQRRVKDPTGTIQNAVFDDLGRVKEQYVGTNDADEGGTDDMVRTSLVEYDSNADGGNSHVTKRSVFPEDGTGNRRDTLYTSDYRGRVLLTTNATAPHSLATHDSLGRATAVALYGSTGNITVGTTDPGATGAQSDRLALSKTYFDELGRVWKSEHVEIDASDGDDEGVLPTYTWYDPEGRVMMVDGRQLTKTRYDRLGRATHQWILATVDDTQYEHASASTATWESDVKLTSVAGDIVLEERQTVYESSDSDNVVMVGTISRLHDDLSNGTTGALDTNADNNVLKFDSDDLEGRIQIDARWYDAIDRPRTHGAYGTNGATDFTWSSGGEPGGSSGSVLVTLTTYNDDGSVGISTDAAAKETWFTYDDLGRRIAQIDNYDDGTPSGATDRYTRFVFVDGLQTKMWADLDGDNAVDSGDQVTEYIYGTTKGTAGSGSPPESVIGTGNLLREVKYPEQVGSQPAADRTVYHAYNAQGEIDWMKDQNGTIHRYEYDLSGRRTRDKITTFGGAVAEQTIERIQTVYDSLGRVTTVTTYDDPTGGTAKSQTERTYDGWGNLLSYEQDADSALGSGDSFTVAYAYALETSSGAGGRNTVRRTSMTLPSGLAIGYDYLSSGNLLDDDASRVTRVVLNATDTVFIEYDYLGVGRVVGTDYLESEVRWELYEGGSAGDEYPDLDRWTRVEACQWERYSKVGSDRYIHNETVTYDDASNITTRENNVHTSGAGGSSNGLYDVKYTLDGLHRLTTAEEGHLSSGTISSRQRDEVFTLDQLGNFDVAKRDLDTTQNYTGTNEFYDNRGFNDVNELRTRDADNTGGTAGDNYEPDYDKAGNLIDDDKRTPTGTYTYRYTYGYDGWNRLAWVKTQGGALVAEYTYNGEGYRVSWHYDANASGTADGSDPTYFFGYDEKWRLVATRRGTDDELKEEFVHHNAGDDGLGGSSYIDHVARRYRDNTNGWTGEADGGLETVVEYCHNWRPDVVVVVEASTGKAWEWPHYLSNGESFGRALGDTDSSGTSIVSDLSRIQTWIVAVTYDVRGDMDGDNDLDTADLSAWTVYAGGLSILSHVGNRRGYAAYEHDPALADAFYHVRNRVLDSRLGRWGQRDPEQYEDGANLAAYARGNPVPNVDNSGTLTVTITGVTKKPCGGFDIYWDFALSGPKPYTGYIVQKVVVKFNISFCGPGIPLVTTLTIWEAWLVQQGSTTGLPRATFGLFTPWTDKWGTNPSPGTKGSTVIIGALKFFKASTTGSLVGGTGAACQQFASGSMWCTTAEPTWWANGSGSPTVTGESHHNRSVVSQWNCCVASNPHTININLPGLGGSPGPGGGPGIPCPPGWISTPKGCMSPPGAPNGNTTFAVPDSD